MNYNKTFIFLVLIIIIVIIASKTNLLTNTENDIILKNNINTQHYDNKMEEFQNEDELNNFVRENTLKNIELIEERARLNTLGKLEKDVSIESDKAQNFKELEGFENIADNNTGNTEKKIILKLFYSSNCSHSHGFMPIWFRLKESIASTVIFEEFECSANSSLCSKENIDSVPTVIVHIEEVNVRDDESYNKINNYKIEGARDYTNIKEELKHYGIKFKADGQEIENFCGCGGSSNSEYAIADNYEVKGIDGFQNYITASQVEGDERKSDDPDCPFISFHEADKGLYCVDSRTMKGCVDATKGSGLNPDDATYGLVGGYLIGLPNPTQTNMYKCAKKHKNAIKSFGLCNAKNLSNKSNYNSDVASNKSKSRFLKVDYDDNKKITNAISFACAS